MTRAAAVLAWHGVGLVPDSLALPRLVAFLRARRGGAEPNKRAKGERLFRAITALGPSYIKLGQFLATRPDVVGPDLANALGSLLDRLPPFPVPQARREIELAFDKPWQEVYREFGPAVAAASIAQVHRASVAEGDRSRAVAVKILRPGIEARFARDLDSFYFAARAAERLAPSMRRLRPVSAVDTLARTVALEMDLRLEAAAISEMAGNIARAGDRGFRVPEVDWTRTGRRVLTLDWIDAIPLADLAAIDASGLDRKALGLSVIRHFLHHAMRDGFFHADMHQGNLFADPSDGTIIAVDFGIMGRLGAKERRFLAEILYGFITRDYRRTAEVHFEAGYVPAGQDVAAFSQALRAIGEPIADRRADEISMARVLAQLLEVTELFQMRMRPELLLLQKTMVVAEGVARSLDPKLNMWVAAEPVVRAWMARELGPAAKLREAAVNIAGLAAAISETPKLIERGTKLVEQLSTIEDENAKTGDGALRVEAKGEGSLVIPLWIAAAALVIIAIRLLIG